MPRTTSAGCCQQAKVSLKTGAVLCRLQDVYSEVCEREAGSEAGGRPCPVPTHHSSRDLRSVLAELQASG